MSFPVFRSPKPSGASWPRIARPLILGRLIDPKEIGDAVAFVCSDRASAINGAALRVDGGLVRSVF